MKDIFFAMYFRARIFSLEISMQNFFSQITHTPPPSPPPLKSQMIIPLAPSLHSFIFRSTIAKDLARVKRHKSFSLF